MTRSTNETEVQETPGDPTQVDSTAESNVDGSPADSPTDPSDEVQEEGQDQAPDEDETQGENRKMRLPLPSALKATVRSTN